MKALLLFLGGGLGTYLRWWIGSWFAAQPWAHGLPIFGTFAINVSGSFLLGAAAVIVLERLPLGHRDWFLLVGTGFCGGYTTRTRNSSSPSCLVGTGFCGGYTTFSSFEWETFHLIRDGSWWYALAYVVGSVLASFAALLLAVTLVHAVWPPR